jgi:TPP-dependent pyruvate/acetoin dehydrogenase alpha subunit
VDLNSKDLALHESVLEIRRIQQTVHTEAYAKAVKIPIHFAFGHEAIALAVATSMRTNDKLLLPHRNIHYHLALGATAEEIVAEYLLLSSRMSGANLGSMNLDFPRKGSIYTSNILGNNLSLAVGVAHASKIKDENSVAWCVTGDGAMEEGSFYESILLAAALDCPVVFIIENNRWSLASEISERRKEIKTELLASSVGLHYEKLSGNNVVNYADCLNKIRKRKESCIVEVDLKTLGGYEISNGLTYRHVNYHAGKLQNSTFLNDEIERDATDPCWVSKNYISEAREMK